MRVGEQIKEKELRLEQKREKRVWTELQLFPHLLILTAFSSKTANVWKCQIGWVGSGRVGSRQL